MNVYVIFFVRLFKILVIFVGFLKFLELGIDCEMLKKFDLFKVYDECKFMKEFLKLGVFEGKRYRNKKRKKSDGEN